MRSLPRWILRLRRRSKSPQRPKSRWRRALRYAFILALAAYGLCVLMLVSLRWVDPPVTMVQVQRRVEALLAGREYRREQINVPLSRVPVSLQHAVIAAEDGRFYEHFGIDWLELRKVLDERARRGRLRGASTITQQLVKNLFGTTHRSSLRKGAELALVPVAELALPKRRILELYLNVIEWGPGVYGVEAAARHHYGVSASKLNRDQAARLAACIPDPLRRHPTRMNSYSAQILVRMQSRGW